MLANESMNCMRRMVILQSEMTVGLVVNEAELGDTEAFLIIDDCGVEANGNRIFDANGLGVNRLLSKYMDFVPLFQSLYSR
ncbi:unnamed protein product [Didymodactylos carnosus]|uniref:Uncharacterized protein n=1 Tax=Didymodactylos carnosus TaxID=1234261 RepID=A0A815T2L3_9BILA|nr:unnamed protein product [Didymodactylos carnosus]CAF1620091.1 unnamed protein product [Didymodactylos carnosus]CAF4360852.1 unnamed protein product [Didymodactylos carnosus]CAF4439071.1 unnamed protein product [Didymodactylos carnosus]